MREYFAATSAPDWHGGGDIEVALSPWFQQANFTLAKGMGMFTHMEWTDSAHPVHGNEPAVLHTCKTDDTTRPWQPGFVRSK